LVSIQRPPGYEPGALPLSYAAFNILNFKFLSI
jgi:hypothetical protein